MKFTKEKLELQEGLKREWLITNGIGGFSSSTIIGANTRRIPRTINSSAKATSTA